MVALRDGGTFTSRIIQPLFACLAYEIDVKGGSAKEIALRLGYDDFNESFTDVGNVQAMLNCLLERGDRSSGCARRLLTPLTPMMK